MTDQVRGRVARLAAALPAAIMIVMLLASPAAAHATLVGSTPANGTVLPVAPEEVRLSFSEPVQPVGAAVLGPDGDRADDGTMRRPNDTTVVLRLPGLRVRAPSGTYTVTWRVISADTHPVGGALTFSIGVPSHPAHVRPVHAGRLLGITYGLARFAAFMGFAILIGVAALCCYTGTPAVPALRRLLIASWSISVVAAAAVLAMQGPYAAGRDLPGMFDGRLLTQTLHERTGTALSVRLILLGLLPVILLTATRLGARAAMIAVAGTAVALSLTWAAAGHSAAGTDTSLVTDVLHLLAASLWLGGLAGVTVLLPNTELADTALRRFSRLATVCVGVLVGTGLLQAWLRVQTPAAILTTIYGRLLVAKAAAVITVLTFAYLARSRLRRRPRPRLGHLLAAETAAAAIVLALTAVLVASPPAAQAYAAQPLTRSLRFRSGTETGLLTIRFPKTTRGVDTGDLTVHTAAGRPLDVPELQASWTQPHLGIGPLPARFTHTGTGRYRASWPPLPTTGTWRLTMTIRTTDIDESTVRTQVPVH
jgi:copper transport protein